METAFTTAYRGGMKSGQNGYRYAGPFRLLSTLVLCATAVMSVTPGRVLADTKCKADCATRFQDCGINDLTCKDKRHTCYSKCEPMNKKVPAQTTIGMYKGEGPEIYLLYNDKFWCHVQNVSQMKAFGGEFTTVPALRFDAEPTGECGWPNGFYRTQKNTLVYRLYGSVTIEKYGIADKACQVKNPAQLKKFNAETTYADEGSDFTRGRTGGTAVCKDPVKEAKPGF